MQAKVYSLRKTHWGSTKARRSKSTPTKEKKDCAPPFLFTASADRYFFHECQILPSLCAIGFFFSSSLTLPSSCPRTNSSHPALHHLIFSLSHLISFNLISSHRASPRRASPRLASFHTHVSKALVGFCIHYHHHCVGIRHNV